MIFRTLASFLTLALVLGACAGTPERVTRPAPIHEMLAQVTEQDGRACIRLDDIRGYAPLDDSLISVSGRRREHFLVTTTFRCTELGTAMAVAFDGRFSEVCGGGTGTVVTGRERCPIRHIYEFPSRDDAFAALEAARARREAQELIPEIEPDTEEPQ